MRAIVDHNISKLIDTPESRRIHLIIFSIFLTLDLGSICCTLFILTYFIVNWHPLMRKVLHNHAIFLLMLVSLLYVTLDLPVTINYYRLGYDQYRSQSFCRGWYWLDYTLVVISLFLTAIASVQRHILVFHTRWLHSCAPRWFLHYLPLIIACLYPFGFYYILIYYYPCKEEFVDVQGKCPLPCYSEQLSLFYIDWLFNTICPMVLIVIANLSLIIRVVSSMDRSRRSRSRTWKRRQRLTFQLLAFSSLYVLGWTPPTVLSIIQNLFHHNLDVDRPDLVYIHLSSYLVCPLQPFICVFALPKLMKLIKNKMRRTRTFSSLSAFFFNETRF